MANFVNIQAVLTCRNVKECNCVFRCSFANVSFIVDCEWQPARTDNDCQRQIEREFNGTDSCYHLTAVDGLTSDETMAVLEEVQARMKDKELYGYKDDVDDPKLPSAMSESFRPPAEVLPRLFLLLDDPLLLDIASA